MASTIPMLCLGLTSLCFVPVVREIPQDLDPQLDCRRVEELIKPVLVPAGEWKFNCVLVPEPCSAKRGSRNKCSKPGDEWIR